MRSFKANYVEPPVMDRLWAVRTHLAATLLEFVRVPFAVREIRGYGWQQADRLAKSFQHSPAHD